MQGVRRLRVGRGCRGVAGASREQVLWGDDGFGVAGFQAVHVCEYEVAREEAAV